MDAKSLRAEFRYCPETGRIWRLRRHGNYAAGSECTGMFACGYRKVTFAGEQMLQHRVAWALHTGEEPPEQVDHVNLDKADNRWCNLRGATASTNQQNILVHVRSLTGVKGIMPVRGGTLFRAEVCLDGRRYQKHSKDVATLEAWVIAKRVELHTHVRH